MTEPTVTEERYDYGDLIAYQRDCDAGCDQGLIYAPVRFCGPCGGSGKVARWARLVDGKEIGVAGPDAPLPQEASET